VDDTSTTNKFVTASDKTTWSGKQDAITSSNKLSSDLVDDADAVNQFVTAADKTAWNNKQSVSTTSNYANSIGGGKDLTNLYTLEELSAKVRSGDFSGLAIGDYITKSVKVGSNAAREEDFVIAGFDYWYGIGDSEMATHHLVLVPKNGFYELAKMNDSNTTTGGYYLSQMHGIASVAYTACTGGALTNPVADYTTFLGTTLGATDGTYAFTRVGTQWQHDGADVGANLNAYGISYSGTPVEGDTLTVTFAKGYLEPYREAIYTAFGDSHVLTFRNYQTISTSAGQWHNSRVELMNECMVYGSKIFANNSYGEMISPAQLPYFAQNPNARLAHRGKGGARNSAWLSSINSGSNFCNVYYYGYANYYYASYAFVVRPFFLFA
jgi:hypothetical protein